MTKALSKLIDSFEMTCYRRILRVLWTEHWTNESIRNELEVKENWLRSYVLRQKVKVLLKGRMEWDGTSWKAGLMGNENEEGLEDSGTITQRMY